MLVSEEQEVSIGKEASPSLKWEFGGPYEDSALEAYLDTIVKELWRNSERPDLPVKFHIQNTSCQMPSPFPGMLLLQEAFSVKWKTRPSLPQSWDTKSAT